MNQKIVEMKKDPLLFRVKLIAGLVSVIIGGTWIYYISNPRSLTEEEWAQWRKENPLPKYEVAAQYDEQYLNSFYECKIQVGCVITKNYCGQVVAVDKSRVEEYSNVETIRRACPDQTLRDSRDFDAYCVDNRCKAVRRN